MIILRVLVLSFLILLIPVSSYAENDYIAFSKDDAERIVGLIDADERFQAIFNVCPAQHFRSHQSWKSRLGLVDNISAKECIQNAERCFDLCQSGHGRACFRVARGLEELEDIDEGSISSLYKQKAFGFACAAGDHAGCTNRGAGLRNGRYEGDPMLSWDERVIAECHYDLFHLGCKDDAWGCAMLGQAYQYGQGVEKSIPKAVASYSRVCKLSDQDHPSCRFARRRLDSIQESKTGLD